MHRATVIGKTVGLRSVARATFGVPAVRTGKHLFAGVSGSGCRIELVRPWRPVFGITRRAM